MWYIILFLACTFFSIVVIISELTLLVEIDTWPLNSFVEGLESVNLINLLTLIPVTYMFAACLIVFFQVKVNGLFIFHEGHTESPTFLFFSNMLSKVGFPLCYNFGQMLRRENKLLINQVITGNDDKSQNTISDYILAALPTVLVLFLLMKLFGFYDYILGLFGFKVSNFKDDVSTVLTNNGRQHLEKLRTFKESSQLNFKIAE